VIPKVPSIERVAAPVNCFVRPPCQVYLPQISVTSTDLVRQTPANVTHGISDIPITRRERALIDVRDTRRYDDTAYLHGVRLLTGRTTTYPAWHRLHGSSIFLPLTLLQSQLSQETYPRADDRTTRFDKRWALKHATRLPSR